MLRRIAPAALWLLLFSLAVVSAVYDCSTTRPYWISTWIHETETTDPEIAAAIGGTLAFLLVGARRVWKVPLRYSFALVACGIVVGHLVWSEPARTTVQQRHSSASWGPR
jgi:hypothetical protein